MDMTRSSAFLWIAGIAAGISLMAGDSAQNLGDAQISGNFAMIAAACIIASALVTRGKPTGN
mgnify:CR=1 FL=1